MNYTIVIAVLMTVVVLGVLLLRRPVAVAAPVTCVPRNQQRRHRDAAGRGNPHEQGSATLWVGALEAAMALVMVLATLALTDATKVPRSQSATAEQVVVDAAPDRADEQPAPASAGGGASPVRPTHRLMALESAEADAGGAIIIELDSPLPADRPVKFLINTNTSPQ